MTATLRLPALASSVPKARRFVVRQLEQWSLEDLVDTVALLTSELVSNAVLHARTEITVTAIDLGGAVQIDVSDLSPLSPVQRQHAADATTGRGMQLLDQLAHSWQVLRHDSGKTVRFTVDGSSDPWANFLDDSWQDSDL